MLTILFAPYGDLRFDHGTPEKGLDIVSDIDYDISDSHTPISGHAILVPDIDTDMGYHVTDIGTPDIVPDVDPDIRY